MQCTGNISSSYEQPLCTFLCKFVLVFFDDILVYSKTKEEHMEHLTLVLSLLRTNQLKSKISKCQFAQPQVEYLGHIILGKGVATDPGKIQDVINWESPKTMKKLRGFFRPQ